MLIYFYFRLKEEALTTASVYVCECVCVLVHAPEKAVDTQYGRLPSAKAGVEVPHLLKALISSLLGF